VWLKLQQVGPANSVGKVSIEHRQNRHICLLKWAAPALSAQAGSSSLQQNSSNSVPQMVVSRGDWRNLACGAAGDGKTIDEHFTRAKIDLGRRRTLVVCERLVLCCILVG
jgi:hypothetical protein